MSNEGTSESKTAIAAAMLGNIAVAVTKFIAAAITGSSAMISEGIHSIVDTGNGALLLFGIRASLQPPDFDHPFGHGKELYFWSFVVAIAIFAVGCGTSIYEGISHLIAPQPLGHPFWNYVVLGFAFLFEGISWVFGWEAFRVTKGKRSVIEAVHKSKDPATFMVLFEDSAALLGLIIAFCGISIGHLLNNPYADGVASVLIGVVLGVIAFLLAYESKGLLIGEGVDKETLRGLRSLVEADEGVEHVSRMLTMHFGPHQVLLTLEVTFRDKLRIREGIRRLQTKLRQADPDIKWIYFASESVAREETASEVIVQE
jgi:cation diffusion facilitator family transporter